MQRIILISIVLLSIVFPVHAFAQTDDAATATSPATGHAAVIAQGVEPLPADTVRWQVENISINPVGAPFGVEGPGFVVADRVPLLVINRLQEVVRLAPGEATFVPAGGATVASLSDSVAKAKSIFVKSASVDADDALFAGDSFAAPEGRRDIDLVRDVLKPNERSKIANGDLPAGILVMKGSVTVENADGDKLNLSAGKAGELSGPLSITASGQSSASFVVGVIGPEIETSAIEPAASTSTPTTVAPETGMITITTYLCPAGVSVAQAAPDTCGGNTGLGSGGFSLSGGALTGPQGATYVQGVWLWDQLAFGQYVISVANPDGYTDFAIDKAPGVSHSGETIPVTLSSGEQSINVYFLAATATGGGGTATLGLIFMDCPAGTTTEIIDLPADPGCTELTEPFSVTLFGDSLPGLETTTTLQVVSPQPSMGGDFQWTDLPGGSYTLTVDPVADGDLYYIVRPCGDQSCPKMNFSGTSFPITIEDGEGFVLIIYRLPAA